MACFTNLYIATIHHAVQQDTWDAAAQPKAAPAVFSASFRSPRRDGVPLSVVFNGDPATYNMDSDVAEGDFTYHIEALVKEFVGQFKDVAAVQRPWGNVSRNEPLAAK